MKIAVVTPYFREDTQQLQRCHDSVRAQTHTCEHILLADGFPNSTVQEFAATHITLPNHADYGDTPRLIGSCHAASAGFDGLLYLDADNWLEPDHVEILVETARTKGADVVTCGRTLRRSIDLSVLGRCPESDGATFNDTNCYFLTKAAFPWTTTWGFKGPGLGIVGDRVFWDAIRTSPLARTHAATYGVNYVTTFGCHYTWFNEYPPRDAKAIMHDGSAYHMKKFYDVNPNYSPT